MFLLEEDLKKNVVTAKIDSISDVSGGFKLDEFEKFIKDAKKQAKKDGCTKLRLELSYDEGDENTLPRNLISVYGDRLETEYEWHSRLQKCFYKNKRDIEEMERKPTDITMMKNLQTKLEAAMETSTLRCEVCGKPETSTCHMFNWKKNRRLCGKCSDAIWEKEMGKRR